MCVRRCVEGIETHVENVAGGGHTAFSCFFSAQVAVRSSVLDTVKPNNNNNNKNNNNNSFFYYSVIQSSVKHKQHGTFVGGNARYTIHKQ